MKTKQITLRFNVPAWVPGPAQWHTIKTAYKTLKFRLRPFTCLDCGKDIDYRFPEYHHQAPGKNRLLLSMSGYKLSEDKHKGMCGHCLAARIHGVFAAAKPTRSKYGNSLGKKTGTIKHKCDGCGETKPTLDVCWDPECDIRFGSAWWNGHHVCEDCLCETAENGSPSSGMSAWQNGHHYNVNTVGAAIGPKHWWTILFKPKKEKKVEVETGTATGTQE